MNGRVGLRLASFGAAAACALLVACGGGGGGGGVTPGGGATSTPLVTPSPAPVQTASVALAPGATPTVTFGPVGNSTGVTISGSSIQLPSVSVATTANVSVQSTAPSVGAPQMMKLRLPENINRANLNVVAYFGVSLNPAAAVTSTPQLNVTLSSTLSAGFAYVALYDPTNPSAGYNLITGSGLPVTVSGGSKITIPSVTIPQSTLAAGQTYYFAIITSATLITPTPPPATPAAFPSGTDSPLPAVTETPGPHQGWTPYQVAQAFQFPVMSGYDGSGQTVVVLGDNPPAQSDLNGFTARMGAYRGHYTTVQVTGSGPAADTGGQAEATLDVETIMGLAPGANIEFYIIPDLSPASFQAAESYVLTDPAHPKIMSISFGGCEDSSITTDHTYYSQGEAAGIAYTTSSGDEGQACYYTTNASGVDVYNYGVNSPASDPSVIAVGGNENANQAQTGLGSLTSVNVWNDSFLNGPGASGGGVSTIFTSPSAWQTGVPNVIASGRNVPDISLPAEGVSVFLTGQWQVYGGTSWSAPQAAALIAEMYQACPGIGTAFGSPAAMFYNAAGRWSPGTFIDISGGNNTFGGAISTPPPIGQPYTAGPGYDQTSGLGLPIGMQMLSWLCANKVPHAVHVASAQAVATQSYGEARDTELHNAVSVRNMDVRGARAASASTSVWIALRNTASHAQDAQSVASALRAAGMTARIYPSQLLIEATAPSSVIASYFRTQLTDVDQGRYGTRYANVSSMTAPASIAPYVNTVVGTNLITRHRMSRRIR